MRGWRALMLVTCLLVAACAGAERADPVANPTSVPPSTALETSPTTPVADVAAVCNGYLVLLRSGDPEPLRQVLDDPALVADLETMLSSEGEFDAIAAAALRLEESVVSHCAERFALGVEPAPDNVTALTTFLDAVTLGDEAQAAKVAWENVVAQFTWSSVEAGEIELAGAEATMTMGSTRAVTCRAEAGVVVSCRFREG